MHVSEYFNLGESQPSLEFVDVDVYGDTRLFVDPRALRNIDSDWAKECVSLLQNFFDAVLRAIQTGDSARAERLLASLSEPNETHLGLSRGPARGRAVARRRAERVRRSLAQSPAATSGLLEDLEDTALFVEGIGYDVVSDMTINIIRSQLIKFTRDACLFYGIPLQPDVASERLWDRHTESWRAEHVELPVTEHGPLLLVPKSIVRRRHLTFDPGEYFNHWILPYLQNEELGAASSLVEVLKNGRRRVTKRAVKSKYGVERTDNRPPRPSKEVSLATTLRDPDILNEYRAAKRVPLPSLPHGELAEATRTQLPNWDVLLNAVHQIPPGPEHAARYHRAVEALLTALLYPALDFERREFPIHQGRKRIDINYTNIAHSGFFDWVNRVAQAPASQVYVECKNYGDEIGNPELDQLSGRFSNIRGRLGFLCYRGFGDKSLVIQRCRDTALDGRGFIIALDDNDLATLVEERKRSGERLDFIYFRRRYDELV